MEFEELLKHRRSVRSFSPRPITGEELVAILAAINIAPSAGNLQAYEVVCVQDGTTKEALAQAAFGQPFVADAPVVLVFLADPARTKTGTRERRLAVMGLLRADGCRQLGRGSCQTRGTPSRSPKVLEAPVSGWKSRVADEESSRMASLFNSEKVMPSRRRPVN